MKKTTGYYYIRPRQDLSISSMASLLNVWKAEMRTYEVFPWVSSRTGKSELLIFFTGSQNNFCAVEGAVKTACRELGRRESDFKIGHTDCDPFTKLEDSDDC